MHVMSAHELHLDMALTRLLCAIREMRQEADACPVPPSEGWQDWTGFEIKAELDAAVCHARRVQGR